MFSRAPSCAFLLALAAGLAGYHVQGFHVAARVGCGALHRGLVTTAASSLPPHAAVRGCTCGACAVVAAAGSGRAAPGEWARGRGCVALGLSMEAGGAAAAAVPEFELSDKAVEVGTCGSSSFFYVCWRGAALLTLCCNHAWCVYWHGASRLGQSFMLFR